MATSRPKKTHKEQAKQETINERIKLARLTTGKSQREFSEKLGKQQSYLSEIEQGRRKVSVELVQLLGEMGFDLNWILYGKSEKEAVADAIYSDELMASIFATLKRLRSEDLKYVDKALKLYADTH